MSSLIEGRELAAFPLFKLLLRMLITFIHIFMLCTLLLIPLLLSLSLPLIQIVKIFLWQGVSLCFSFDTRVSLLKQLEFFLQNYGSGISNLLKYPVRQDDILLRVLSTVSWGDPRWITCLDTQRRLVSTWCALPLRLWWWKIEKT
jgi:hypothetical protein